MALPRSSKAPPRPSRTARGRPPDPPVPEGPSVEKVEYRGWKNNLRLSNAVVEVLVTLDVGPRILVYRLVGGANVLKEYAGQLGRSGEPDWQIRGGHRLWTSPEDLTRTYVPDNQPVSYRELPGGTVRLIPPADEANGIQKEIDLTL